MEFDVLLPAVVFTIAALTVVSYQRLQKTIKTVAEEKELGTRDIFLMVLAMGIMVTVIAFIPGQALQVISIAGYSFVMFSFTYAILKKLYVAVIPPVVYVLLYFSPLWNVYTLNLFAAIFAIMVTTYLGALFTWKTTWIFAILLTLMDIFQVFVTGFMGESATKMLGLNLPIAFVLPAYPVGRWIILGLGDVFLSGLLSVQTTLKRGTKSGILTAFAISVAVFVFEAMLFNSLLEGIRFFPATVIVILGWAASFGITRLMHFNS